MKSFVQAVNGDREGDRPEGPNNLIWSGAKSEGNKGQHILQVVSYADHIQ